MERLQLIYPKVSVSTILYWSLIEGGIAVIAACLPTLRVVVGKASLSSLFHSIRSALSLGSKNTPEQSQQLSSRSEESYVKMEPGSSSSSTSRTHMVVREKSGSVDNLVTGNVDGLETKGHGIQVTRKFSQHASMVWVTPYFMNKASRSFKSTWCEFLRHAFHGTEWTELPKSQKQDSVICRHSTEPQ